MSQVFMRDLCLGLRLEPLCAPQKRSPDVPHAPTRNASLTKDETKIALSNALRYFPQRYHHILAPEFASELKEYGHIYMYRFKPFHPIKAYPIDEYPTKSIQAAAIMLMICNNLDPQVAQFPEELVTYGGNGQVFSNWAQLDSE
ncbi:urocanate hydratase-like [Tropilaelaps mercedesae]|uniref:Urocanate hydratase-like n=1 Tax=Tropilaelaps mercedesae TaxID=418985 RepID=A0A1V9XIX6_9ACAR|nr:urocanate hydratase-like [Tropilaelaps mercedesae]